MADVELQGRIMRESDLSILFFPYDEPNPEWLPKSEVAVVQGVGGLTVTMPEWLARKKGWY